MSNFTKQHRGPVPCFTRDGVCIVDKNYFVDHVCESERLNMAQEEIQKLALEEIAKGPKEALLKAAKRSHNNAMAQVDVLQSALEQAQYNEKEARAYLDELRSLFNDAKVT